jgi:predicted nuclease of predicted toxin-antitoxin system
MKNKVILLDNSVFVHRAIFSWASMVRLKKVGKLNSSFLPPVSYTYFSMIISTLCRIGINQGDIIIVAQDGRDSWRKDYYAPYKANRKEYRESHEEINWEEKYNEINNIILQLKKSEVFHWIQIPKIEADDIMAVACKHYKDKECIIVSIDKDLEQLAYYENVKIYSLLTKYKNVKGAYKIVNNPLKIILDKVKNGDVSDNILVDKQTDTQEDYNLREFLINLLKLPDFVVEQVTKALENLLPLNTNLEFLPYTKSLALKFKNIYLNKNVITYEEVVEYQLKKEKRLKNKKLKAKKIEIANKRSFR